MMEGYWELIIIFVLWFGLMKFVLPKLGIPT